ncbi:hypothetical protein QTV49_004579 [Vibrio vulnificus]|nr:hypothetical protein [Vibrio vulnificus]
MINESLTQRRLEILRAFEAPKNTASFVITGTFPMLGSGILFRVSDYSVACSFQKELNSLFPETEEITPAKVITVDQASGQIKDLNKRIKSDKWVKENLEKISVLLSTGIKDTSLLLPHSDKAEQYKVFWEQNGIPYHFGLTMYLLSYGIFKSDELTIGEWVLKMVLENYHLFKLVERVNSDKK